MANEFRISGLGLQSVAASKLVLRQISRYGVKSLRVRPRALPQPISKNNLLRSPVLGSAGKLESVGFTKTMKSVKDEAAKQSKIITRKIDQKTALEGVAKDSANFVKAVSKVGEPKAAAVADLVGAVSNGGPSVLMGRDPARIAIEGAIKFTTSMAAGGGVAGGVVGVTSQAIFRAAMNVSELNPQMRKLYTKVIELRTANPSQSYSQILKQMESKSDYKPIFDELRTSSSKVKEGFFKDLVSGLFYSLLFSKAFRSLAKEVKKDPNVILLRGEFDDWTILRERDDLDDVVNGVGISIKEIQDMTEGVKAFRDDLDELAHKYLEKIKQDAKAFKKGIDDNEGLNLAISGKNFEMEVMMLLADEQGRPLIVLYDAQGNILRTGQDTMHILQQDEYLTNLLGNSI